MSMYDLAVSDGRQDYRLGILPGLLGLAPEAFGRPRDAWMEKKGDTVFPGRHGGTPLAVIAVYARIGGPNRDGYAEQIRTLKRHPLYLEDTDDEFDSTYATFRFRTALDFQEDLALDPSGERVDTDQRWKDAIEALGRGDVRPGAVAFFDQLTAAISDSSDQAKIIEI